MIIGAAIMRLLSDFKVDLKVDGRDVSCRKVNFHYGDHKELIKWITSKDKSNSGKYPLVWYVVKPYTELNGIYYTESQLIIFQNTQLRWFNDERFVKTYTEIIEPVYQELKNIIEESPYMHVEGKTLKERYRILDEPSYGVNSSVTRLSENDFQNRSVNGEESVSLDFVDGKIININFRIQPDCIK